MVAAHTAEWYDEMQLLSDRREGKLLLSYETAGGWVAITKTTLTEVLGSGRDAKLVGLPPGAVSALKLLYPQLVIDATPSTSSTGTTPANRTNPSYNR